VITPEQRAAIDSARKDIVDTRQQLRAVQYDLNRGISRLETELRVFNIVLVPVLLAIVAIVLAVLRNRRRARARA
jgi:gliding motility-associatede transport system auxiliary component